MVKKRLIFTLLFNQGYFVLSRNFRLQKVGDLRWLQTHYNFSKISYSIDELVVLDVSRGGRDSEMFHDTLRQLTRGCFVPIAAGGGITSVDRARGLLRAGADKVVVNTAVHDAPGLIDELAAEFGRQCVIASVDVRKGQGGVREVVVESGGRALVETAETSVRRATASAAGEIYLNSVDRDGTGQGYDLGLLDMLPQDMEKPVILAGGVGNWTHLAEGLSDPRVDAAATAHLFNFVGDGLKNARRELIGSGVDLPVWDAALLERHLAGTRSHTA